uniref:Uncharacterized protein n=1 Tax=Brassica oleracea var. oleracea TaxID=109376 RepID=A0A0D3AXD5_BRAOL
MEAQSRPAANLYGPGPRSRLKSSMICLRKIPLLSTDVASSAYWKGSKDPKNPVSLQRVYGISYPDQKQLKKYLQFLEEAKKYDHRILGQKQEPFFCHPLRKMTNDNNTPIDTTDVIQTPLNAAATYATGVTTASTNISVNRCINNKHYPPCGRVQFQQPQVVRWQFKLLRLSIACSLKD